MIKKMEDWPLTSPLFDTFRQIYFKNLLIEVDKGFMQVIDADMFSMSDDKFSNLFLHDKIFVKPDFFLGSKRKPVRNFVAGNFVESQKHDFL
jgi:hypothetical protein